MDKVEKLFNWYLSNNRIVIRDFRTRATQNVAIAILILFFPFAINHFIHDRPLMGYLALTFIGVIVLNAIAIRKGYFFSALNFLVLIVTAYFLYMSIKRQEIIGLLWCYPAVCTTYFLLKERDAWLINIVILGISIPSAYKLLEASVAIRFVATLLVTSVMTAIFFRLINRQQIRLAEAEQKRREGMASVSHELRLPLYEMMSRCDDMLAGTEPVTQSQIKTMASSIETLTILVEDLYELALTDVNALSINIISTDLVAVIDRSIVSNRPKLSEKNIRVYESMPQQMMIEADPKRLKQVFDHLFENAYRHAMHGATVKLSVSKAAHYAEVILTDDGPGVSRDALRNLFERYYKGDDTRNKKMGGAGLGLSVAKEIIDIHDGQITAFHSTEGGLGFKIRLPVQYA